MGWRDRVANFLQAQKSVPVPAEQQRVAPVDQRASVAWSEMSYILADAKYNPDDLIGRKGFDIYKRMMMDEQVKSVMHFKRSTVTGREWYFHLDAEKVGISQAEAEKRVDVMTASITEGYRGALTDGLNAVMKAQWQGYSMSEQMFGTFEYDGKSWWCLNKLRPKPFDTFFPIVNDKGDILRWVQRYGGRGTEIKLDMRKFVYYVFNSDMDEHYGWSDLRAAYRPYLSKDITIRYRNVYMERLAGGFPVVTPREGHSLDRNSAEWNAVTDILRNITGKSAIILPAGLEIEIHYSPAGQATVFKDSIDQDDLAIAKAALVPNLIGMSPAGQTGSYSQSDTQFDVFMIVSDTEAGRLEDAMNEQVFLPLARQNFGDDALPRFCFKPLSKRRVQQVISMWKEMLSAKGVQASDTDEAHVRKMLEFPDKGELLEDPAMAAAPAPGASTTLPSRDDSGSGGGRRSPPGRGEDSDEDRDAREEYRRDFHGDHDQSTHNPYGDVGDLNDRPAAQAKGQSRAASILRSAEKGEGYSKAVRPRDFEHSQELRAEYNATRVVLDKTLKEAGYKAEGNQAEKNLNVTYTHEDGSAYRVYGGPRRVQSNPNATSSSNNLTEYHIALQVIGRRRMGREDFHGDHDQSTHNPHDGPGSSREGRNERLKGLTASVRQAKSQGKLHDNSDTVATLLYQGRQTDEALDQIDRVHQATGKFESTQRALDSQTRWQGGWAAAADEWEAAGKMGANGTMGKATKEELKNQRTGTGWRVKPELSEDDVKAFSERRRFMQDKFRQEYGDELVVYRGMGGKPAAKALDASGPDGEIDLPSYSLSSWSTSPHIAQEFAKGKNGVVVRMTIKAEDVWLMPRVGVESPIKIADAASEIVVMNRGPTVKATVFRRGRYSAEAQVKEPLTAADVEEEWMDSLHRTKDGVSKFTRAARRVAFAVIHKQSDVDTARAVMAIDAALLDAVQDAVDKHDFENTEARHFEFDAALLRKVENQVRQMLKSGMELGADHARREIGRAKKTFVRLNHQRLGELAAEWLKNKSFTIAGDLRASAVKEIKQALLNGLKQSKSSREVKTDVYDRLARKGILSGRAVKEALAEGDLGELADQLALEGLAPHHLETVVRTNMFEAINEARFNMFTDPVLDGFVSGFEYSAILDSRTTEICEHMDGRSYTTARWESDLRPWVPPNHFNCRSLLIPITVNDEADMDDDLPSIEPQEGFG